MQDPEPMPWGALDRYQAHFIVRKDTDENPQDYLARTALETSGRFAARTVVSAGWDGGRLADILNADEELNGMISELSPEDASITVEPTDGAVRIHGKWQRKDNLGITEERYRIYDRIAGHVRDL